MSPWRRASLSLSLLVLLAAGTDRAFAQVSLTALGTAYTQNFDTLPASGSATFTNNSTIPGWYSARTGTGTTIVANDGSSNAGNLYSYGTGTATDRALGSLGSGNAAVGNLFWGVRLQNNTGSTITTLDVSYTGEQWRNSAAAAQTVAFSYLVGSPTVTGSLAEFQSAGVAVTALDFTSPITGGAAGALNGNLAANRTAKTFSITGLGIPNGTEVMLRWSDPDHTGSDHGLSIDDLSVTPRGAVALPNLTINDVSLSEGNSGTTSFTFTVSLSAPAGAGGVTFDIATADGTATAPSDYTAKSLTAQTIPAGSSTYSFTVLVNGDTSPEPNETFFVNVTNVSGATVVDGQGLGTIVNDDAAPNLTINDVSLIEGDSLNTTFTFTVSLSAPAPAGGVTFDIATADGTATASSDYTAKALTAQTIPAGSSTYTFDVLVNGDTTPEPDETFFVNVTNVTNAIVIDGQGLGTIINDDFTRIHDIQGNGASSPLVGTAVITRGIVTGVKTNGFFIQEPDATVDADPATSEGVFVFTNAAPPAAAAVGNYVQVSGTVSEFVPTQDLLQPPTTEITTPTTSLLSTGNPLPAPIALNATFPDPAGPVDQLERLEGMRVSVASLTVIGPTQGTINEANATSTSNGVFYGVVTGVPRPFREPGIPANDPAPSGGSIPPIPRFDANPERIRVDSDALVGTTAIDVGAGAIVTGLIGPLDYGFRTYTIDPDPATPPVATGGPVPTAVSVATRQEFTVASYNMQRFFDTVDDPAKSDVALTAAAFNRRLAKASLAIRDYQRMPDIIGVEEMENLSTLQAVASQISTDAVAAGEPDPQYAAYLVEGNDIGGIDVGFLVKTAPVTGSTPRVTVNAVVQESAGTLFVNPDSSTELLNDRPPLRLMAVINTASGASYPVTVIVNHLRSLSGANDESAGSNGWATVGTRVRTKRQKQAEDLANLVQARQSADSAERIILVGDFNAFEFNDGLGDSMDVIAGTPVPDNQTAVAGDGVDLVNPDLVNLDSTPPPSERYSYNFDGNAQTLDHLLVNAPLISTTLARRIEHARVDSDFPDTARNNATTPTRLSDHDPLVGFFQVAAFAVADLAVTKVDTPDPVTAGTNLAYTITVTNNGPDAAASASWSDTLPAGTTFVSLPAVAGWSCTTPAVGAGGTVSCSNPSFAVGNATFTLTVAVAPSVAPGTVLTNTATATSTTADGNPGNESGTATTTVAASADLSMTKADTPDPVIAGTNLTYTITATNAGPSNATSVSLSDTLPAGTTFVSLSSPGGWSCTTPAVGAGGTVSCSNPTLAAGSAVFTLTVAVDPSVTAGTVLSNTATVSSATSDPNPGNESGTATTTVATVADLSMTKADTPDPVIAGTNLTYTITATNAGPSNAGSVSLSDTLPAGTTFVSLSSPSGWSCTTPAVGAGGTVSCSTPSLAAGSAVFTLTVAVDPSVTAGTVLSNTATASSATSDPNPGNESGTATTTVATSADLSLTKVDTPDPVIAGTNLTYTITATNAGPSNAASVSLSDTLPPFMTFVSLSSPGGWSCTTPAVGAGGTVSCSTPTLVVGSAVFTLTVSVSPTVTAGTVLSNTATVSSATPDPNPGNESGTATTTVGSGSADLSLTKVDTPDPVAAGMNLTYTITATNAGPSSATSASMSDTLPAGTTFVSLSSPGGWSCTTPAAGAGGTVSCSNPSLAIGSAVFTLTVAVDPSVANGTVLSNTATASSATSDPNPGNESGTATTTVATVADLSVTKVDTPDPVGAGSNITYTVTVSNAGPSNAAAVSLSDTLPAGTKFVSLAPATGWSCTSPAVGAGGTVSCSAATLGTGSAVFTLIVSVDPSVAAGTVFSNTATVSSSTTDPNPGNDSGNATTTVGAGSADLSVTKVDSPDPVNAGANLVYTITVSNAGPSDATTVALTDTLPTATTFVSLVAPAGWSCTNPAVGAGGTVSCSSPSLTVGSAVFTLTVQVSPAAAAGSVLSNTATVTSATTDPNPGNESATATTTVLSPASLSATKSVSGQRNPGGTVTYAVVVSNAGPSAQSDNPGHELTDVLPPELQLLSATASSGTAVANAGTNTVTWDGAIAAGGSVTITVQATIKLTVTAGTSISNQATIAFDADGNGTNESSGVSDDTSQPGGADATAFVVVAAVASVPALDGLALAALAAMLAAFGALMLKR